MRSEGIEFPTEEEIKPQKKSAPVSKDPNVVSSQQEADDIAKGNKFFSSLIIYHDL